ncbi:MAG: FUSC family protein [Pseudomonadota bacterium]
MPTSPTLPTRGELLFSLKCFIASMLALYVALAAGLPRPFWAMMTAYIVASPLAGAVRSKAAFRLCGTVIGSLATVWMVPRLANAPELLSLALACWVGLCLYISLLDRTPRSYVFMLAGYTAGLIGFPAVSDPSTIFDTALARMEEVGVGILAATLVHSLVFPQGVAPALLARLDRAIGDAQRWAGALMHPAPAGAAGGTHTRLALAAEIGEMRVMSTHLPFDTSHLRWTAGMVHGLHDKLTMMVPLLLAVEDRLQALRSIDPASLTPRWQALLDDIAHWMRQGQAADPARAAHFQEQLAQLSPALEKHAGWSEILRLNLARRLAALVTSCAEGLALRGGIGNVMRGAAPSQLPQLAPWTPHRDHGMALRSALAAIVAILVCCGFWIATAWPSGAAAPMMAGVFCCFFATQDDPVPAIRMFLNYTLLSMPLSALYILGVLPAVHSFEMLALTIAPVFLVAGVYAARPSTGGPAMAFLIGISGTLAMQDTGPADMPTFANSMLAQLAGYVAAAMVSKLLRTVSGDWMVRRLLRTARAELAAMAETPTPPTLLAVSARMVDRIGMLMPRLAMGRPAQDVGTSAIGAMRELRIGLHIAQLRALQAQLEPAGVALAPLLRELGRHFRSGGVVDPADAAPALLFHIDGALRAVCAADMEIAAEARLPAAAALASMRRDLFPCAASYQPISGDDCAGETVR